MSDTLYKLRPDRDLQCYFERPSAIAAMSEASETGFVVSGCWRQQFDWAVVEWNRDNTFEHPALRNLPDGDLSHLMLTYEEERDNCMEVDSSIYPTVDWPFLRIWSDTGTSEQLSYVRLKDYATAITGTYHCASAELTLQGTATAGDYVGVAWQDEQYNYFVTGSESAVQVAQALVDAVNSLSTTMRAQRDAAAIRLTYVGAGHTEFTSTVGANGNRIGVYGFSSGARTFFWSPWWKVMEGGTAPSKWRIQLDFSNLHDISGNLIPTNSTRKMRWTYASRLQYSGFQRSEFRVKVSNWQVTGTSRDYRVAGPGSLRIDNTDRIMHYTGLWTEGKGNFYGGSIHQCTTPDSSVSCRYKSGGSHTLYLGTRITYNSGSIEVSVDSAAPVAIPLQYAGEDTLARLKIGEFASGEHDVEIVHRGNTGEYFYFDFLEVAIPIYDLPSSAEDDRVTLATDWDTDHSISLPAERTAWILRKLGFTGRVNHYVGALWFYEMHRAGHQYASATITFVGSPVFSATTQLVINRAGQPTSAQTVLNHLNLIGETAENVAKAFELVINSGYTAMWAVASGNQLTIYSRSMGSDGNELTIASSPATGAFTATVSVGGFAGGVDGEWRTDLVSSPRINRAARDWSRAFCVAIKGYGLDITSAFSMELQHGDPSEAAGIAQRYPSGNAVLLNTPAIQTNFSPQSQLYWRDVYRDMAAVMSEAGCQPYLQFGEVQWWYFPYDGSGLPFHDEYTRQQFHNSYGFYPRAVPHGEVSPAAYPEEAAFLSTLIGEFTSSVISYVLSTYPNCRFEVLYPVDVNEGAFNRVINYASSWNPATLACLKTESFTYTGSRNLDKSLESIQFSHAMGFGRGACSHLIGIGDPTTAWLKEASMAKANNMESIVLFALDQFCLIGLDAPLEMSQRRATRLG